jgi:hypothetical protein
MARRRFAGQEGKRVDMLSMETWKEYRGFIEFRIVSALEKRTIEYWADVTREITAAVVDLGAHSGYSVTQERRYHPALTDAGGHRCDVHWRGAVDHIWEIDRTFKEISANKLLQAREPEKIWVLWAKDADLVPLRFKDLTGINILIVSQDIRKLVWDRLLSEKFHRLEVRNVLGREERFQAARKLEEEIRSNKGA